MRRAAVSLTLTAALVVGPLLATAATSAPLPAVPQASTQAVPSSASASVAGVLGASKKYANCTALNKKYPGGVAKSKKARNTKVVRGKKVPAASQYKPKVSAALYAANKTKDRDKDGIACER
ncbi:excalibur calcium-binding domain-containing protein [Sanguibacter hominis]|uniref:excalibur calcium-binding domain-containing protein n=1 Tax=Sanguibacter hominis TaxID=1312739 RepID=UPI0033070E6F